MLKSCSYCGRVHDSRFDCGKKPKKYKRPSKIDKFRGTKAWQQKREEIRQRDSGICQVCYRNLYDPGRRIEYDNLSVHHAISMDKDFEKRLDNDNLLTLCGKHHEMAESGAISYGVIKGIIDEQEKIFARQQRSPRG